MNKFQKGVASAIAAGSILLQVALPAMASTTIQISGNAVDTNNSANVDVDQSTYVTQSNYANVSNVVYANADTGDNDANGNTGGDVEVTTGNATANVSASNTVNSNLADVGCCGTGDIDVLVSGNGNNSENHVDLDVNNDKDAGTLIEQKNFARMNNYVNADADSGKNDANSNSGGDVEIHTGSATVDVDIENTANANSAKVGGGDEGMSLSARILNNAVDTNNSIDLDFDRSVWADQSNMANIHNVVLADADSGRNDANSNTGGVVEITTGNAKAMVGIDNLANFNWADLDCGCVLDVTAKVAGNGNNSENHIDAYLDDVLGASQTNFWASSGGSCGDKDDFVYADADTGKNDANSNNGGVDGADPSIGTGNATVDVDLYNTGNANYASLGGETTGQELPDLSEIFDELEGLDFEFGFNLSFVWLLLSGMMG